MFKRLIGFLFMVGVSMGGHSSNLSREEIPKPLVVILMGPPGAGKGTHAAPLSNWLAIPHISTGDLFRENIREQTSLGKQAKEFMDQGSLVPDKLVLDMLFERVGRQDCKGGYILDGFPRTIPQAKALDERLEDKVQLLVVNFNLPDAVIIERIAGRFVCRDCARTYHKKFDPPKLETICDACGGELFQRNDDKEEIIRKRLEVYRIETEPLIEYYKQKKEVLREIDSRKEKQEVFHDLLESLSLQMTAPLP